MDADSRVLYAFPVFVNPTTGKRVFLNDEIVAGFNQASADVQHAIDPALGWV